MLLLPGCVHESYTYVPEQNLAGADRRALDYPIFAGPREGSVRVTFVGRTEVERQQGGPKTPTLQVRMDVKNDTDAPWTLDVKDNYLSLPGYGEARAAYVQTSAGQAPEVTIRPATSAAIDLHFPLPEGIKHTASIPDFTFVWQLRTPDKTIAQRTEFERVHLGTNGAPAYAYSAYPYGYGPDEVWGGGPYWWYDPYWVPWSSHPTPEPQMLPPKKR